MKRSDENAKPRPQDKETREQQHTGNHDQPEAAGADRLGGTRAGAENVEPKKR
jgi:hypothetical protein